MWFAEIEHFKGGKRTEAKSSSSTSIASPLSLFSFSLEYAWFIVCAYVSVCENVCLSASPSHSLNPPNPSLLDDGLSGCSMVWR